MPELVRYGIRLLAKQFLGTVLDIEVDQSDTDIAIYPWIIIANCRLRQRSSLPKVMAQSERTESNRPGQGLELISNSRPKDPQIQAIALNYPDSSDYF